MALTTKHTWINAEMRGFHAMFVVTRHLSVGFFMVRRGGAILGCERSVFETLDFLLFGSVFGTGEFILVSVSFLVFFTK